MQSILGQDRAVELIQAALRAGRMHHGWIFSGPRGVGKFTCALELAKILLDSNAGPDLTGRIEADPDGETARLVESGAHPDLHVIRKELARFSSDPTLRDRKQRNIPVGVLRQFMIGGRVGETDVDAPAFLTAMRGHGKVFVIDEAELIDRTGQGALLKTLEEPPARTFIILVTNRPERLLPTIHSRCQHVRFGRLDAAAMARWFDRAALSLDAPEQAWIEAFADGAPGAAMIAAEYGFHAWHERLEPHLAALEQGRYPPDLGPALAGLVDEFAEAWVKRTPNASKDAANKDGGGHLLGLLAARARRGLGEHCDDADAAEPWLAMIDLIRAAERELEANVNLKLVMENLVVQLARRPGLATTGACGG